MKVGDLVRCIWQPTTSRVENDCAMPMEHTIKGEFGIIVKQHNYYHRVLFPKLGYEHDLAYSSFEVISESG